MQIISKQINRDIKANIEIMFTDVRTFIILIAVAKDFSRNNLTSIVCKKGVPLCGYVYDTKSECYYLDCVDFAHLGYIPFSVQIKVKGVGNWRKRIPLPESVVRRYLTSEQKDDLKRFRVKYPSSEYNLNFVQFLDCHVAELRERLD
jgi:hypothetical protein